MARVPFPSKSQLCSELSLVEAPHRKLIAKEKHVDPPSSTVQTAAGMDWLAGQPWIKLHDQPETIAEFLRMELITNDLDKLAPHLWLVAKQSSDHISSLTHQLVRGREIVVTENPGLHLTWIYKCVFIKPLPEYVLSYAFWDYYLVSDNSPIPPPDRLALLKAARGFLRSYAFLIQHEADYLLATHDNRLGLVPKSVTFHDLVEFLRYFKAIPDTEVSPRYAFGDLRLTRINFWVKVSLRRSKYFTEYGQYGAYFSQLYGPILFVFGVFALALNSMQVVLAVEPIIGAGNEWMSFAWMSRGFSVFALFVILLSAIGLIGSLLAFISRESLYAVRDRYREKRPGLGKESREGWWPNVETRNENGRPAFTNT
ncbi:hypothetical protein EDB80DRAFT_765896 [Ilyonectria destructans]|nr:hypothetical protein EDB80DRAFT_765896 [Ilyonectria destructans]